MITDYKTPSQLYCLLFSMAALKLWHIEVAAGGLPKPAQVMAKPQDSVNIKENVNCRRLCKALGDFGKLLFEINLESRKRQLERVRFFLTSFQVFIFQTPTKDLGKAKQRMPEVCGHTAPSRGVKERRNKE